MLLAMLAAMIGCGFFNPDDPPDPLWGVWTGPYPETVSAEPDSARWAFASHGVYLFYALKADGTLLGREVGYYHNEGIVLTLSEDPAGKVDAEELTYHMVGDRLTLEIRGAAYTYRRIGDADDADRLDDVLHQ